MSECQHKWKKWEKEQHIFWSIGDKNGSYYQRRECKSCGYAQWTPIEVQGLSLLSGNNLTQV